MTWNYRVIENLNDDEPYYTIEEVYYNEEGKIESWTEGAWEPLGSTLAELEEEINHIQHAFDKPILTLLDGKLEEKV